MAIRRPLVVVSGTVAELPTTDTMIPATNLDLEDDPSPVPDAVAVRVGGTWGVVAWDAFLDLVGSVSSPYAVTVNGTTITVNGTTVEVT